MPIPEIPGASGLVCLWKACDIVTWKIKIVIDCPVCQVLKLLIESFASIHVLIGTCMTVKPTHSIDLRYFFPEFACSRYLSILKKGDFEKETLRKALVQASSLFRCKGIQEW